jgi:eukaryotic-like serine/threonine-protein kinase
MRRGFEGLMVGRTLAGRYEVVEALARGGMSVVFRGIDRTLGREVGVKVVSLAAASDQALGNFRERFRREAASAARIQHPNVVQIFDYGTDPELELDFIVMELLRGRDLKETLAAGPLPRDVALRVLAEAARGVAAGHRAGIVHRDVKPANVFLVGDDGIDGVKILDFGIAKPLEDDPEHALTTIGSLPHSPAYASPEQLDPSMPVTAASDVYQLGLIGYEMLAGRRPYDEQERALVRAGQEVPLPVTDAWRSLPPHVCEVVQRALRPRPADRFPDAEAFVQALADARAEDEATALHVAAPVPDGDATELLSATAGVPIIAPATPEARPAHGAPATAPAARRMVFPRTPVVWAVPLLLLLAIALWAARGRGGDRAAAVPADSARTIALDTGSMAALDEEFLRLQGVAAKAASAQAPAPASSSETPPAGTPPVVTPPAATPPTATAPAQQPATPADTRAQAETAITAAVHDLNKAWVEGDISRHVGHYGSRVDYYNSRRLPRAGVRRDRTRDMRRYDDRRIAVHSIQVQWPEADRARVLVDKEWIFGADGQVRRRGRGMQEYIFKRDEDDGKWYVVSEQLLTTNEARAGANP